MAKKSLDDKYKENRDPKAQLAEITGQKKCATEILPDSESGRPKFKCSPKRTKYGKRHTPGVMNQTEQLYADILQGRKIAGEVIEWHFEAVTLKVADGCRYLPDFIVFLSDGSIEMVDTKGSGPIDPKSLVKIKCAAERFWYFQFVIEQRQTKKNGNGWDRREF